MSDHPVYLKPYSQLPSTNTEAKRLAQNGAPEGTVVTATRQTAGRGRFGRSFFSPPETGLYMSLVVRPRLSAEDALLLTTAAAVAVAQACEEISKLKTDIKWVNDIYQKGRKIAGILTEGDVNAKTGDLSFAVIGIGINLKAPENGFPEGIADRAGALFEAVPENAAAQLRDAILSRFFALYDPLDKATVLEEYRKRSCLDGKTVTFYSPYAPQIKKQGTVLGIQDDFSLCIKTETGETIALSSGEVSVVS